MHGIFLLDKPQGLTSHQATQQVRHLFKVQKAGHTGSLDPLATGLLPICLGEATKFSQFLLTSDKHYWVQAKLGVRTHTGDSEGECYPEQYVPSFSVADIQAALSGFRGLISQIPPMVSALKHAGKPLYQWARLGISIERKARQVFIRDLVLLEHTKDTLTLEVRCSKGTYMRSLVDELGETLGCGAHVIGLRRLGVGNYQATQMKSLNFLTTSTFEEQKALLLPIESALPWPSLLISKAAAFYLRRGQAIALPRAPSQGWVCLKRDHQFIGLGHIMADGRVAPYRLMSSEGYTSSR